MKKGRCCICGKLTRGKRIIEARKGKYYYFCKFHFERYSEKSNEELRLLIKQAKMLLD
jgi:hypothetical protein